MRYQEAHAAKSGSVPFALRGKRSLRTALSAAVAGVVGVGASIVIASPAYAVLATNDFAWTAPAPSVTVAEGGTANLEFGWVGTGSSTLVAEPTTVSWRTTTTGTATAGADFTAVAPTVINFDDTTNKATLSVTTLQDTLDEADETIVINAIDTSNNDTVVGTATITITDDDPTPSIALSVDKSTIAENVTPVTLTATLSAASGRTVTMLYSTANGTATAGQDYTTNSGTITFNPGETVKTVQFVILDDNIYEGATPQTFQIVPGTVTNATSTASPFTISITDNEAQPTLSIAKQSGTEQEGNSVVYRVTASAGSEQVIGFHWDAIEATPATAGRGKATPGTDFPYPAVGARTVAISPGSTTYDISLALTADGLKEQSPEEYALEISAPTNASLGTPTKVTGVIADANADAAPTITLSGATITEGDTGKKTATITANLSGASGQTVTADWATESAVSPGLGDAVAGKDYITANGQLVFAPGTTTQTFAVDIVGDMIDEGPSNRTTGSAGAETFAIAFTSPMNDLSLGATSDQTVTITDDDNAPTVSLSDIKVPEGNTASALLVPVKLTNGSDHAITIPVTATGGTASDTLSATVGSGDYSLLGGNVLIPAESTTGYAVILVDGDEIYEADDTVILSGDAGSATGSHNAAFLGSTTDATATVTLTNDDKAPDLKIDNVTGKEGETVTVTGTVSGVSASTTTVNVTFAGAAGGGHRAASAGDFTNPGVQSVPIAAGTLPGTKITAGTVALTKDSEKEPAESIQVSGFGVGNIGTVTDGWITIAADDGSTPTDPTDPTDPEPAKPTITTPMSTVTGGSTVTVAGKAAKDAEVWLWGRPFGTEDWLKIKMVKADAMGNYSFARWIGTGYQFRTSVGEAWSDVVTVRVKQSPMLTVSSPSKGKVWVGVTGNPKIAGSDILVQSWVSGAWKTVWKGELNSSGAWSSTASIASGKSLTLRAFVAGDTGDGVLGNWTTSKKVTAK